MTKLPAKALYARSALHVRLGQYFEAQATGWGVAAIPVVLGLVLGFALLKLLN